jgi:hypothetical protein
MLISQLSLLDIFAATLAGMALGFIWYSEKLFGEKWLQSLGKTRESLGSPTVPMIGAVFASIATAIGIALLHLLIDISTLTSAIGVGLLLGLLIIFPAMLSDNLFCKWDNKLLLIQSGYRVFTVLIMSMVIYWF